MVRRELGLVKRKKGALDGLFDAGKISQSTYDRLNKDLTEAMARIEADQRTRVERMTSRANELERQSQTLEMFLANLEIQYAAEEIDEKVYEDQGNAIALGLGVTKRELADIKEALIQLTPEAAPKAPVEEITIKEMIQKIRVLEEMVMEAAKKKAELEAKVKALEEERACLLAEIEALKAVPELETKVSALETDIAKLKEEKKALEEKITPPPCEAAPPPAEAVPAEAPAPAEEKPCEEKPCE